MSDLTTIAIECQEAIEDQMIRLSRHYDGEELKRAVMNCPLIRALNEKMVQLESRRTKTVFVVEKDILNTLKEGK